MGRAVIVLLGHAVFSLVVFASSVHGQDLLELSNERIKDELLIEILNNAKITELEPPRAIQSRLFLRLFAIGELGTCEPETETEVECSVRYYLAVSNGDLGVAGSVFYLGEVGEISKIIWLEPPDQNVARLRLEVLNYPEAVFRHVPNLTKRSRVVEVLVSLDSLTIRDTQ